MPGGGVSSILSVLMVGLCMQSVCRPRGLMLPPTSRGLHLQEDLADPGLNLQFTMEPPLGKYYLKYNPPPKVYKAHS